mgnify:CR=1 FL=1
MAFLGTFEYSMDDRGRVPVPPRYRDVFRQGVVLSQGSPDRCVKVFTIADFEKQAQVYLQEPATRLKGRLVRRAVFSRSHQAEVDAQGRILIPPALRRFAGLERDVVVIGAGECLEIWSPEALEAYLEQADEHLEPTLESLEPRQ